MKIDILKNKHPLKSCIILTCGPSLNKYTKEEIINFSKDKIVICVKDTIYKFHEICDYFVCNDHRDQYYLKNVNKKIVTIFQYRQNSNIRPKHKYNIYIPLEKVNKNKVNNFLKEDFDFDFYTSYYNDLKHFNFSEAYNHWLNRGIFEYRKCNKHYYKNCILYNKNFNDYEIDIKKERPYGPGIMYETVFYLCNYMGIKNIYTIGWDVINNGKDSHFLKNIPLIKDYDIESNFVNNNIMDMVEYFKTKNNMNINVVGESPINSLIPRINLQNVHL